MDIQNSDTATLGLVLQQVMTAEIPVESKIERALELGEEYLDVDTGVVTQTFEAESTWKAIISTEDDQSQLSEGTTLDLSNTYCRRVVQEDQPLKVHNAPQQGFEDDPAYQTHEVEAYFGTPLYENDEVSGTVCFVGQDSRDPFDAEEALILELIARFIESEIIESQYETELEESSELVSILARVLRHNIRNKLTVVKGYLNQNQSDSNLRLPTDTAMEAVDSILDLSEEARKLEKVAQQSSDKRVIELTSRIDQMISDIKKQFPNASFDINAPDSVEYFARPTLSIALQELIENAAKHADDAPDITIEITDTDDALEVTIHDTGPGLPEQEQTVLAEGTETPLVHSSGLGLWITNTIVTNHNGTFNTSVSEDGTTVHLSLPRTTVNIRSLDTNDYSRQEYDKFKQVFEEAFEPMVIVTNQGRIIESNDAAAQLVDLAKQNVIGRRVQEFIVTESDQSHVLDTLLAEEQETVTVVDTNGEEHIVEYSATPDIFPNQHLLIGRDITEQQRREQELDHTRDRLEFALEVTDTIVWEWNVDEDQATFYPSEESLYGTTIETREDFIELIHPDDRQEVRESLQEALETGEPKREQVRIITDEGIRWIDAPGKPIVEDGTTRMVGVVRDITEQKERE